MTARFGYNHEIVPQAYTNKPSRLESNYKSGRFVLYQSVMVRFAPPSWEGDGEQTGGQARSAR